MAAQQSPENTSAVLNQTRQEFEASRKQVFFVDSSVPGYEQLVAGLGESGKVFTIDANGNALAQIASSLESIGGGVDGVHIYSHGRDGALQLGGQWVDSATLDASADILNRIGNALSQNADILLYGCNVAKTASGQGFVERVAALTRADVAASSNTSGNAYDWVLEHNTGTIETAPVTKPLETLEGTLGDGGQGGFTEEELFPDLPPVQDGSDRGDSGGYQPTTTPLQALMAELGNSAGLQWGTINADGAEQGVYLGFHSNDIFKITNTESSVTVAGGDGNDVYYVDNGSGDVTIREVAYNGSDTVISRVQDFVLQGEGTNGEATHVENIFLDSSALDTGVTEQNAKGNEFTEVIEGNSLSNHLVGGGKGGVVLNGYEGDDYLDGGDGILSVFDGAMTANAYASTLVGGLGDDNYIVRNELDVITEKANEGVDNVFATTSYDLGKAANVENLTLMNSGTRGAGNGMDNVLKSAQGNSTLLGGAGNDTLYAALNGFDVLDGGTGNDAYYVYSDNNTISDAGGNDTIYYAYDGDSERGKRYSLVDKSEVENLVLDGKANIGFGNSLANRIEGNKKLDSTLDGGIDTVADTLVGGQGNDLFVIRTTSDLVIDNGSNWNVEPGSESADELEARGIYQRGGDSIAAHVSVDLNKFANADIEHVFLQNGAGDISATAKKSYASNLVGNDGNNTLTGGGGDDTLTDQIASVTVQTTNSLAGGDGNDIYHVHSSNTTVTEAAGQGWDVVHSHVAEQTLAANVEQLVLEQLDPDAEGYVDTAVTRRGVGNDLANYIDAGKLYGTVVLEGGKNSDEAGDTLVGGSGTNHIHSYNSNDKIVLQGGSRNILYVKYDDTVVNEIQDDVVAWKTHLKDQLEGDGDIYKVVYMGDPTATTGTGAFIRGDENLTSLKGSLRDDTLYADTGRSSTLDGGAGADLMVGSMLGDVFYVDDMGDTVDGNGDYDAIKSTVSIDLTGQHGDVANAHISSSGTFNEVELLGADKVNVWGNASESTKLTGNSAANSLFGGSAADVLDGAEGADYMEGGAGSDEYYIDNANDRVVESADTDGSDIDSIFTNGISIDLGSSLHANVEYVKNTSISKAVSMTGTARAETFEGFEKADPSLNKPGDTIDGKGGGDTIHGGATNDVIHFYLGSDQAENVTGGNGTDTLVVHGTGVVSHAREFGDFEAVQVVGSGATIDGSGIEDGNVDYVDRNGGNWLAGGYGNDTLTADNPMGSTLVAGSGDDVLVGGDGNDYFKVGIRESESSNVANASHLVNDGGDTITMGKGENTVEIGVPDFAEGQQYLTTLIKDFDWSKDILDDSALLKNSWSRSADNVAKTITYTNGDKTYVLQLPGADLSNVAQVKQVASLTGDIAEALRGFSGQVVGTTEKDIIDASNAGAVTILANGGSDSIIGSDSADRIEIDGVWSGETMYAGGGSGDDTIVVKDALADGSSPNGSGEGQEAVFLRGLGGDDHFQIASIDSGTVRLYGDAGDDDFTIESINGGYVDIWGGADDDTMHVKTINAGDVVMVGQSGKTVITVDTIFGGRVELKGENPEMDDTVSTSSITVKHIESAQQDEIRLVGGRGADTLILENVSDGNVVVRGEGGSDSIVAQSITGGHVSLDGAYGRNSIEIGSISEGAVVTVRNADNEDTVTVNSISGGSLCVDAEGGDNVITMKEVSGDATVTLRGVYFDTQDAGNNSITLENVRGGTTDITTDAGDDSIYIRNAAAGTVFARGGEGTDTFYLTNIASADTTAPVSINLSGGNNPTGELDLLDKLVFEDTGAVNVSLGSWDEGPVKGSAEINIRGIESVAGTKYGDSIDASNMQDTIYPGMMWQSIIDGGAGDDTLVGGGSLQLRGGAGDDLLIATATTGTMWVRGGEGSDTLSLEKLVGNEFTLKGGYTAGHQGSRDANGIAVDGGNIVIDEDGDDKIEFITFGEGNNTLVWNAAYDGKLDFETGNETLVIGEDIADGSVLNIIGFGPGDSIDANGWTESKIMTGGQVKYTFTHGDGRTVYVNTNEYADYRNETTGKAITVSSGGLLYTSQGADSVTLNLNNSPVAKVITTERPDYSEDDYYWQGYDTVTINVSKTNVAAIVEGHRGSADYHNGGDEMRFSGSNAVTASISSGNGNPYITAKVSKVGSYATDITLTDFNKLYGSTGNDKIDASGLVPKGTTFKYYTNGGADTYMGGAGSDYVVVDDLTTSQAVNIDGGANGPGWVGTDKLKFKAEKTFALTVNAAGNIASGGLKIGTTATKLVASNIESYRIENKLANIIDAKAYKDATHMLQFRVGDVHDDGVKAANTYYGSNVGGFVNFQSYGVRVDTYNLYATSGNTIIEDYGGTDTFRVFSVNATSFSKVADLSKLRFSLATVEGEHKTPMQQLIICGLNGANASITYKFSGTDGSALKGETLTLYKHASSTSLSYRLLGGGIDLQSIVDVMQKSNAYTNAQLTFGNAVSSVIKATGAVSTGTTVFTPDKLVQSPNYRDYKGTSGDDVFVVQANDYDRVQITDHSGADTVRFFGVDASAFNLDKIHFGMGDYEGYDCLYVGGVNGTEDKSQLGFATANMAGNKLEFYGGNDANSKLLASVDLGSVWNYFNDENSLGSSQNLSIDRETGKVNNWGGGNHS